MTLNIDIVRDPVSNMGLPRIVVMGVGGAGCNAVGNLVEAGVQGAEFIAVDTDIQVLHHSKAQNKLQIGKRATNGLGAGMDPEIGYSSAEESLEDFEKIIEGARLLFFSAGMGGGTGSGALPLFAETAKRRGILTIGVVTRPFQHENIQKMRIAEDAVGKLLERLDTLLVIHNQKLFTVCHDQAPILEAFRVADRVLESAVRGITDLIMRPGLMNLDFADIASVMRHKGKALIALGEAEGEDMAVKAAENAILNQLLDDISLSKARALLVNIAGGAELSCYHFNQVFDVILRKFDNEPVMHQGITIDPELSGKIRVTVFATGIDSEIEAQEEEIHSAESMVSEGISGAISETVPSSESPSLGGSSSSLHQPVRANSPPEVSQERVLHAHSSAQVPPHFVQPAQADRAVASARTPPMAPSFHRRPVRANSPPEASAGVGVASQGALPPLEELPGDHLPPARKKRSVAKKLLSIVQADGSGFPDLLEELHNRDLPLEKEQESPTYHRRQAN